jgi:hypothetical protein
VLPLQLQRHGLQRDDLQRQPQEQGSKNAHGQLATWPGVKVLQIPSVSDPGHFQWGYLGLATASPVNKDNDIGCHAGL